MRKLFYLFLVSIFIGSVSPAQAQYCELERRAMEDALDALEERNGRRAFRILMRALYASEPDPEPSVGFCTLRGSGSSWSLVENDVAIDSGSPQVMVSRLIERVAAGICTAALDCDLDSQNVPRYVGGGEIIDAYTVYKVKINNEEAVRYESCHRYIGGGRIGNEGYCGGSAEAKARDFYDRMVSGGVCR